MRFVSRGIAALLTLGLALNLSAKPAAAQRAVEAPSAETAGAASEAPPPPGDMPSFCGPDIICGGELTSQVQALVNASSRARASITDDSNLDLYANYSNWLSLFSTVKFERARNDNLDTYYTDRNALLRSEALSLPQLFLAVRPTPGLTLYGGKIHPNFGSAYDQAPGIFNNFGTDYEQDERIGVGAEYVLPDVFGQRLRLSAEAFFLDTSFLSNSVFSRPSFSDPDPTARPFRFTHGQFGPSNTESLSSYTVALRGGAAGRGLSWQISGTKEANDDPTGKTEWGQSISAMYDPTGTGIPLGPRLGVTPFAEYAHLSNFANTPDMERHYLIGGLTFNYVRWQLIFAGGLRRTDDSGNAAGQAFTNALALQENRSWDHQENVSLNYTVPFAISYELTVGAGVNHLSIAGKDTWSFGPSANLSFKF